MTATLDVPTRSFPPLHGFGPTFAWGLRLTMRGRRFFLVTALAVGIGVLLGYAARRHAADLRQVLDQQVLKYVLPLIALTLVSQAYAREVQDRTLVYHLVRPVSRSTLFLARYVSGLLPACLVSVLLLASLVVASRSPLSDVVPMLPGAILGIVAVGAIYYVLAALLKHGTVAGLVYTFVFEALISSTLGSVQKLSVMFHVRSLHHRLVTPDVSEHRGPLDGSVDTDTILRAAAKIEYDTTTEAVVWLLAITVVFLLFGVWRTRRRDFALKD